MFFKSIYTLGDRLEDVTRTRLSHVPLVYAALGGVGIILFWRGIWHTADDLVGYFLVAHTGTIQANPSGLPWWDGPLSIAVGSVLLLSIGLFVTSFIGDTIIISGLKSEKKITEKTEQEVFTELKETHRMEAEIHAMHKRIQSFEQLVRILIDERKVEHSQKVQKLVRKVTSPIPSKVRRAKSVS